MSDYKRNISEKINYLLDHFPVVVILGVRQAGKTTFVKSIRPDWKYYDLEKPSDYDAISYHPEFLFQQYPEHVIFDEAQFFPKLFNILRGVIDENRQQKGRYLITGSSSPELLKHASESLAGRVAIVELGTLKANEYYETPFSPFYHLFENKLTKANLVSGASPLSTNQMQSVWLRGGYPEPVSQHDMHFYQNWMENYRNTYVHRDLAQLFPKLNKQAYQRFLSMLAKLSGTIINRSNLARAIEMSEGTIREYLQIADGTYIWRQLPSFEKNIVKSIVKMPKGYLRDSGLLHYMLRLNTLDDLINDPTVGLSFESFVIEELLKGLNATLITNWQAYYYRTRNGAEIDLILDGNFGTLPIEIKYGHTVPRRQLQTLQNFIEEHNLPFGMVINQSTEVMWLTDKVIQIPVGWI